MDNGHEMPPEPPDQVGTVEVRPEMPDLVQPVPLPLYWGVSTVVDEDTGVGLVRCDTFYSYGSFTWHARSEEVDNLIAMLTAAADRVRIARPGIALPPGVRRPVRPMYSVPEPDVHVDDFPSAADIVREAIEKQGSEGGPT